MTFDKDDARAALEQTRREWKERVEPGGDRDAFFFWAGSEYGTTLTQSIYKDAYAGGAHGEKANVTNSKV